MLMSDLEARPGSPSVVVFEGSDGSHSNGNNHNSVPHTGNLTILILVTISILLTLGIDEINLVLYIARMVNTLFTSGDIGSFCYVFLCLLFNYCSLYSTKTKYNSCNIIYANIVIP